MAILIYSGLESSAALILTDSGGMQKEAFFQRFLALPCVRKEWTELLPGGHNRLACPLTDSILGKATEALAAVPDWTIDLYGDGRSSELIASSV